MVAIYTGTRRSALLARQGLVAIKEKGDAFGFGLEKGLGVGGIHGSIQGLMGLQQGRRHRQWIVEVRQRGIRETGTRVEDSLSRRLYGLDLLGRWGFGPREVVIDDANRVLIIAFQSSSCASHPSHVHGRRQNSEMPQFCVRNNPKLIAT